MRVIAGSLTRWRSLRVYLLLSALLSLALFAINVRLTHYYSSAWIAKGLLLCLGNLWLVREASRRLPDLTYAACASMAVLAHTALRSPAKWPSSWLEICFSSFALCSLVLGVIMSIGWRDWNGRVLSGYLLLDSLTLYCATVSGIGVAVSAGMICCYIGWITVWALEGRKTVL